jgi:hypothetical protein
MVADMAKGVGRAIIDWADKNRALISGVFKAGLAVFGLGSAFLTLGVSFQVISLAAGGFAAALGVASTVLAAVVSPVGLLVGGLTALTAWFATSTEAGRQMAASLAGWFKDLADTATTTFQGIAAALSAGDIAAAAEVLWAGLRVAWLQGTDSLRQMWLNFTDVFQRTVIEAFFNVQTAWTNMTSGLRKTWNEFTRWFHDAWDVIVTAIAKVGETDAVKAQLDKMLIEGVGAREVQGKADIAAIEAERKATIAGIEAARQIAHDDQSKAFNAELAEASKELETARKRLSELSTAAQDAAKATAAEKRFAGGVDFAGAMAGGLGAAKARVAATMQPQAMLDTRLIHQMISGGGSKVDQEQLDRLTHIEAHLQKIANGRGGIVFT